jgi:hypothetical protein
MTISHQNSKDRGGPALSLSFVGQRHGHFEAGDKRESGTTSPREREREGGGLLTTTREQQWEAVIREDTVSQRCSSDKHERDRCQ